MEMKGFVTFVHHILYFSQEDHYSVRKTAVGPYMVLQVLEKAVVNKENMEFTPKFQIIQHGFEVM